jgi:phage-related protein
MKAALVFLAGSMASDARNQFIDQFVQQGHVVAQTVLSQLQQQILGFVQQAVGQLSALVGSFGGRFDFNFNTILDQIKPIVTGLINQALVGLQSIIGGMY